MFIIFSNLAKMVWIIYGILFVLYIVYTNNKIVKKLPECKWNWILYSFILLLALSIGSGQISSKDIDFTPGSNYTIMTVSETDNNLMVIDNDEM